MPKDPQVKGSFAIGVGSPYPPLEASAGADADVISTAAVDLAGDERVESEIPPESRVDVLSPGDILVAPPGGVGVGAGAGAGAGGIEPTVRRSDRVAREIQRRRLVEQAVAVAEAAEAEARRVAEASASSASYNLRLTYTRSSRMLLPLFMVPATVIKLNITTGAGTGGLSFASLFDTGITPVCDKIWGKWVRTRIQNEVPGKIFRDFFERTSPGKQCSAVIGRYTEDGLTPCWICGEQVGRGTPDLVDLGYPECEHKLPILWALLVGGLYDANFAKSLKGQESTDYMALLKREYAWSHSRCNQIKNQDVYIQASITSRGGIGVAMFSPNKAIIADNLRSIVSTPYTTYRPTHENLRSMLGITSPKTEADWVARRTGEVAGIMQESYVEKLNSGQMPVGDIVSRLVTGLLDRAVQAAEGIVRGALEGIGVLTDQQRANFVATFARLGIQLGGGEEPDEITDIAISLTKAVCLPALQASLFDLKRRALAPGATWPPSLSEETEIQIAFVEGADALAKESLKGVLARASKTTTPEAFLTALVYEIDMRAKKAREASQLWLAHYTPLSQNPPPASTSKDVIKSIESQSPTTLPILQSGGKRTTRRPLFG